MTTPRAADLLTGTHVIHVDGFLTFRRTATEQDASITKSPWSSPRGLDFTHAEIDRYIRQGAKVMRLGEGVRAADLPVGTIVANEYTAWVKDATDRWDETGNELGTFDRFVEAALDDGAQVLRFGDGVEA